VDIEYSLSNAGKGRENSDEEGVMKRAMRLICPLRNSMTAIRENMFSISVKE